MRRDLKATGKITMCKVINVIWIKGFIEKSKVRYESKAYAN